MENGSIFREHSFQYHFSEIKMFWSKKILVMKNTTILYITLEFHLLSKRDKIITQGAQKGSN